VAEELIWSELKDLNEQYGLEAHFNETSLKMTLKRNGSYLQLAGADDKREIEKYRGRPFHEVGCDEAASWSPLLLDHFINRIVGPRLGDYRGTIWLIGTPGHSLIGPFWQYTRPASPLSRLYEDRDEPHYLNWDRWSKHAWHLIHNTKGGHLKDCPRGCEHPHLWDEALLTKLSNGWDDYNPIWRREYCGEWALDDTGYVYKFREYGEDGEDWNAWDPGPRSGGNPFGLPTGHEWQYVYGVDMGFKDPFALNIWAYAPTTHYAYHAWGVSRRGLVSDQIAELLQQAIKVTGYPEAIVADTAGLGDWIVAEMSRVHGLPITPAKKKNKPDAIELFNSQLLSGRVKVIRGSELQQELQTLQWDPDKPMMEHKGMANHNADSSIYVQEYMFNKFSAAPGAPPPPSNSMEALEIWEQEEEDKASRQKTEEEDFFDDI
jgi:hypothetical protein